MKKQIYILCSLFLLLSCNNEDKITESDLDLSKPKLTALDNWIRTNFTKPYNIEIFYKWDENQVDLNKYLYPPTTNQVLPIIKAVKKVWLDTYKEVAGEDFVKKIAPRELLFVGGPNLNSDGTTTLGMAEAGKRIVFFDTNLVDILDKSSLATFIKTIQHEYIHIINQAVPFNIEGMRKITPDGYTAQWFNKSLMGSRKLGFITSYARANVMEDFAETLSVMLSNNIEEYELIFSDIEESVIRNAVQRALSKLPDDATDAVRKATTDAAKITATPQAKKSVGLIKKKEAFIANYFQTNFGISIYELQRVATKNIEKITD